MKYKKSLANFFKKTIVAQILLLIVLAGVIYLFKLSFDLPDDNIAGIATLVINFETEKRFFEGEVVKNMTILDALNVASSVGKIKLNYAIDESGNVNVREIDGHTNGVSNKYFVFYLNSKKVAARDLNKKTVRNEDKVEILLQ